METSVTALPELSDVDDRTAITLLAPIDAATQLKIARIKLCLGREDMATLMRVTPEDIRDWEHRYRRPSGAAIALIALVYTYPVEMEKCLRTLHRR
ncbi:helix-turn-helix domain-containing protein [Carnimonas nigrificans]|uniref:helix-turn-helix domain-containing protein n=1 Tax=Carnimonas nigrificans TaxID=64323 RepID=UPI00047067CB|nr:transcriptional regulator [Carnimonas nigrificans]